jgi:starch-binding outer membrane protein SusE/F
MKNIFKPILTLLLAVSLVSCEDESNLMFLNEAADFAITSPTSGSSVVLTPDNPSNPALTLTWEKADFGTPTSIDYTVEAAKGGTDFTNPVLVTSTNNTLATLTVEELNGVAANAGLDPFVEGALELRIKATIGTTGELPKYSNVITYLITPYTTELPKLAVPGNHQGWDPPTAPRLAASAFGETDYEGYVWLNGEYKFVASNASGAFAWGNTDYGDDGTFSNVLLETGEVNCNNTAGYYLVKANTTTLTYSATPTSWAITGAATPNGWPDPAPDHDMTYNPTTKKWEITIALTAGEFKFRANNGWTLNLGADNDGDGSMDYGGPNLSIATAGTYTVTLDLSNPRAYTYNVQ